MSASSTPTTTRLCASWATVEAKRAACAGRSRGRAPCRCGRSRGGARSRRSSPGRAPGRRRRGRRARRLLLARVRDELAGDRSRSRARARAAGIANASAASGRGAHRAAHALGDRRARERLGARRRRRPARRPCTRAPGTEGLEVVEQHEVGAHPGRDRAAVQQPVAARGVQRGHQQRRLGRDPLLDGDRGTSGRCAPRGRGSRARGRRCRTRSARGRTGRRAAAGRAGCARSRPRAAAPTCRGGASPAPRRTSSPRGRSGCRRRRRRRARGRSRPGRGRRRGSRRRLRAGRARRGTPAMTPGKFIISATPSARGWRRIASMSAGVERAHGGLEVARRHARRRHHEDVERQALGRLEHPLHALAPEHVGHLVRVGDHGGGAVRHDRARELGRA